MTELRLIRDAEPIRRATARPQLRVIEGGWNPKSPYVARWALAADGRLACRWRPGEDR